jgi:hypothetical protein
MFANNVGKTGVLFPSSHPYYKVQQAELNKIMKQNELGFRENA